MPYPRTIRSTLWGLLAATSIAAAPVPTPRLVSGEPIRVTQHGGIGLLAAPNAYKTVPFAALPLTGGDRPDLLIHADRGIETGAYLYRYLRVDADNQPVYAAPQRVTHPFGNGGLPDAAATLGPDGKPIFYFAQGRTLTRCRFDAARAELIQTRQIDLPDLPASIGSMAVVHLEPEYVTLALTLQHGGQSPDGDRKSDDFSVFNGMGLYRGVWPFVGIYRVTLTPDLTRVVEPARRWSADRREIRGAATLVPLPAWNATAPRQGGLIATGRFGSFYYFPVSASTDEPLGARQLVTDPEGRVLRHPTTGGNAIACPSFEITGATDLLVGGEGALYRYRATGQRDARGVPTYHPAQPVRQADAPLYAGSLPVVSVSDWDGDGQHDLIVGNSEGRILFFKNFGEDRHPSFGVGVPLHAGGREIHLQQGYWSVQNISEARWGYACPAVADWNGDGLPDLLVGSALQPHLVYLNVGTRTEPRLDAAHILIEQGIHLAGMWRTRPGVADMGGRMAYVMQDDRGALARYWRVDDVHVESDGPLRLASGQPITLHVDGEGPGQKGRPKIDLTDWDNDGILDLFIGTAKRGAIPNPQGLPWSRNDKGQRRAACRWSISATLAPTPCPLTSGPAN